MRNFLTEWWAWLAFVPIAAFSAGQVAPPLVSVNSVRIVHERGAPALEILTAGGRVIPQIQTVASPPGLVIDLPNARLEMTKKRIAVRQENIVAIRTDQTQQNPPATRITLDLLKAYDYSWSSSSDRLIIRLRSPEDANRKSAAVQSPSVSVTGASLAADAAPAIGGSGVIMLAGKRMTAGSITAGSETAVLSLSNGGNVLVCPGTSLSVTPSANKRDLMLGLSLGGMEADYSLGASADSMLTPDFRIMFAGPGHFHFAVSADAHGTTCVRALPGNSSSAIVSELIGNRIYQVRPAEEVVFRSGQIDKVDTEIPSECGCPAPLPAVRADNTELRASEPESPERAQPGGAPAPATIVQEHSGAPAAAMTLSSGPETAPLPPSRPGEVHVQIDAPFVFSAKNRADLPPPPVDEDLSLNDLSDRQVHLDAVVQPPPLEERKVKNEHPGVFRRIGRFFASIFR